MERIRSISRLLPIDSGVVEAQQKSQLSPSKQQVSFFYLVEFKVSIMNSNLIFAVVNFRALVFASLATDDDLQSKSNHRKKNWMKNKNYKLFTKYFLMGKSLVAITPARLRLTEKQKSEADCENLSNALIIGINSSISRCWVVFKWKTKSPLSWLRSLALLSLAKRAMSKKRNCSEAQSCDSLTQWRTE